MSSPGAQLVGPIMNNMRNRSRLTSPVRSEVAADGPGADAAPGHILALACTSPDSVTVRVALRGEADHFSCRPLWVLLTTAAVYGYRCLVLDCRRLRFCDSALMSALVDWQRAGGQVRIEHPPPQLRVLLAVEARRRPPSGRCLVTTPPGSSAAGLGAL
ncbi:STAS domain-containing protein [Streptomyces griseorubiginosus]|uniref:STAS domain-containing protein n=1 Tax=Streptomyces griseorubiginosus TaxID=67304 RepID=UPI0036A31B59